MVRHKHSDSYGNKHHPESKKALHHPLCHHIIQKRHAYKKGGGERSASGTVHAERDEAFSSDERKNLNLAILKNPNVEEKVTPHSSVVKRCTQCDHSTSNNDYRECNLCCKHEQTMKNDLLAQKVKDKKKNRVGSNARKHIFGVSTRLCKHFVGRVETTNVKKKILKFLHDPIFPMVYHFHKQQLRREKITLNRSKSCPSPYSSSKPKVKGRLYRDSETQKLVQFESSKTACEETMPSVLKAKVNANFNKIESIIVVRDVKCSSVSTKGQNSLKKKIEHVTGESKKEKIRVGMDSVIHKIPQGQEISDGLKKEILKKLTDPIIIPRENQYKSSLRRIKSLQELLESYPQFEEPKLENEKENSPLGMMIPLQRTLSLPDLQSFTYASQSEEILNVHSKNQLQFDKLVEDLAQEKFASTDESDLVISNIVKSGSDCINKINGMVDLIIDDFGHNGLENCSSFNDQYIEAIREYRAAIAASDSKIKQEHVDRSDNVAQKMEFLTKKLNHEIHVDNKLKEEFNYVKYVLEISGLTSNDSLSAWYSRDTPVDPSLYEEMENDPEFCPHKDAQCNHQVLFDLINETMLEIYGRSHSYPPMVGCHTLHKVWTHMSKSLCLRSKGGQKIDDHVSRDLSKNDGWVNGQFHDEGVGLEVEDMVFHDLLEEIMLDFACL